MSVQHAKFEPEDGKVYSGAGQSILAIIEMTRKLPGDKKPMIIALYEALNEQGYSMNPDILEAHNIFPGAFLQIGLQLPVHNDIELEKLGSGAYDQAIEVMAASYKSITLPIFLRIGYEFDGEWNGYKPQAYKKAYRRIVDVLRRKGVENVAFIWNSYICDNHDMFDWYPDDHETGEKDGDSYVDWFSYNTITAKFDADWYMEQAALHGKPVMIGESSYAVIKSGYSFGEWVDDFFSAMKLYGAKGYQYINWEWQVYPECTGWTNWADGRYTASEDLNHIFNAYMLDRCLLFRDAAYHEPAALFIDCARALREKGGSGRVWDKTCDHASMREGYDYFFEDAVACYGDGWITYLESVENRIRATISLPGKISGFMMIKLGGNIQGSVSYPEYVVMVNKEEYRVRVPREAYLKFWVETESIIDDRILIEIKHGSDTSKVRLVQLGLLIPHENSLRPPGKIAVDYLVNGADIHWEPVIGAMLYNVYMDYQLIGMTGNCSFLDHAAEAGGHSYCISAYDDHAGEGRYSEHKKKGL